MLDRIWYGLAAAFIFIGMVATVYLILIRVFSKGDSGRYIVAIPVTAAQEDIGARLYSAHMRRAILGDVCKGKILVVDQGMSEGQKNLCLSIMRECGNMELCTAQEVKTHLE